MDDEEEPLDPLLVAGDELLERWRIDEARATYERAARAQRSADVLDRLAFCAELRGEQGAARRLYAEARALEPEAFPRVPRLSEAEFEREVRAAIERLPAAILPALDETEVVVAPLPTRALVIPGREEETPPDLLGLFVGASRLERAEGDRLEPTPIVYLFQRNIERACADVDELREEIVVTLYHELGHLLGFDEDGVADLGLE